MLNQYGPDLLEQSEAALELSRDLVRAWLTEFMFRDLPNAVESADAIAKWLSDHAELKSHSRHIPRTELQQRGLVVKNLEDDPDLQDLSLSVFHAATHAFNGTPTAKIVENHLGRAFVKQNAVVPSMNAAPGAWTDQR